MGSKGVTSVEYDNVVSGGDTTKSDRVCMPIGVTGSCGSPTVAIDYKPRTKITCFVNHCTECGADGTLELSEKPGTDIYHNQVTCKKCGADFCAKDGMVLNSRRTSKLKTVSSTASIKTVKTTKKHLDLTIKSHF